MGAYVGTDPFHINDIQPVLQDGKYWMKGDVFLSLRSIIPQINILRKNKNDISPKDCKKKSASTLP